MKDNYLDNIRNEIITTEAKVVVRNYKNNLDKLTRNYNIGKEIRYYIDITIRDNLSKRQLSEKIKSDEYHRLPEETRNKLLVNKAVKTG